MVSYLKSMAFDHDAKQTSQRIQTKQLIVSIIDSNI